MFRPKLKPPSEDGSGVPINLNEGSITEDESEDEARFVKNHSEGLNFKEVQNSSMIFNEEGMAGPVEFVDCNYQVMVAYIQHYQGNAIYREKTIKRYIKNLKFRRMKKKILAQLNLLIVNRQNYQVMAVQENALDRKNIKTPYR